MTAHKREVAEQALKAWQEGARTGDWLQLIGMLTDDVTVTMPFGEKWRGTKHGRTEARELFRHAAEDLSIRLDQQPSSDVMGDGAGGFAWELVGEGTVGGKPAHVPICLWFTVSDDGKVAAIREYVGDPQS